jgi:hypothetical protein
MAMLSARSRSNVAPRRRWVGVGVVVTAALVVGCGGAGSSDTAGVDDVPKASVATKDPLALLPSLPDAEREAPRRYVSHQFEPREVVDFYQQELNRLGWSVAESPSATDDGAWHGAWMSGEVRLDLVAHPLDGDDNDVSAFPVDDKGPGTVYEIVSTDPAVANPVYGNTVPPTSASSD